MKGILVFFVIVFFFSGSLAPAEEADLKKMPLREYRSGILFVEYGTVFLLCEDGFVLKIDVSAGPLFLELWKTGKEAMEVFYRLTPKEDGTFSVIFSEKWKIRVEKEPPSPIRLRGF